MLMDVLAVLVDLAKLTLFVAATYAVLMAYTRRRSPHWAAYLTRRRLAVLGMLTLMMSAIKVMEDVLSLESGPVDTAVLWWLHAHTPATLAAFFTVLTQSGSARVLLPASVTLVLVLLVARRHFEALLMGASMLSASLLVYTLKAIVGRERPALWDTQWYWGSSFPSGHTLSTAAFAGAAALCLARLWPPSATGAMLLAWAWAGAVALSRLVLGVHWPSDVLAALCLGSFIPLGLSVLFDQGRRHGEQ